MEKYDQLLEEIQLLSEKCKKREPFNAFLSIGVRSQEVMHSKFIALLLNPEGEHKHKNEFLNRFLKQIEVSDFNTSKTKVKCEKNASGRRIDIVIENPTQIIIIENKVWAIDQENQLFDYYKYGIETGKEVFMIYLTPYGHDPSNRSMGDGVFNIQCISYESDIIPWIKSCASTVFQDERLYMSLKMYEELI